MFSYRYCNLLDADGKPAGGFAYGTGFTIVWQDGPVHANEPNGASPEMILSVVAQRLKHLGYIGTAAKIQAAAEGMAHDR
jgi:hypothetical protein